MDSHKPKYASDASRPNDDANRHSPLSADAAGIDGDPRLDDPRLGGEGRAPRAGDTRRENDYPHGEFGTPTEDNLRDGDNSAQPADNTQEGEKGTQPEMTRGSRMMTAATTASAPARSR